MALDADLMTPHSFYLRLHSFYLRFYIICKITNCFLTILQEYRSNSIVMINLMGTLHR